MDRIKLHIGKKRLNNIKIYGILVVRNRSEDYLLIEHHL